MPCTALCCYLAVDHGMHWSPRRKHEYFNSYIPTVNHQYFVRLIKRDTILRYLMFRGVVVNIRKAIA